MYEIYQQILDKKGLKNSDVAKGAKVSNMTLSDWKHGRTNPKTETMVKIANFLDVSVDYLTTAEEKKKAERPKELYTKEDLELLALIKKLNEKQRNLIVETIKSFAPQND